MEPQPTELPPPEQLPSPDNSLDESDEWIKSVVGRDWEIFWKPESRAREDVVPPPPPGNPSMELPVAPVVVVERQHGGIPLEFAVDPLQLLAPQAHTAPDNVQDVIMKEARDEKDDEESWEHEADWYAARVLDWKVTEDGRLTFDVRFVGDDTVYEMPLKQAVVRPCARAWIRRTRALFAGLTAFSLSEQPLQKLPPDTSILQDKAQLAEIRRTEPAISEVILNHPSSLEAPPPSADDVANVRQLAIEVRSQVFLRSQLAPVTGEDGGGEDDPTEQYLNYLVKCLWNMELGCQWYRKCWELHSRVFRPALEGDNSHDPLSPDVLFKDCLEGARQVVMMLVSMDASLAGSKRKRRAQPQPSPSGTRRTKRRRKDKGFTDFWHEGSDGKTFNEDVDEEDFRSTHIVKRLVEQIGSSDARWYSQCFGKMLRNLSDNLVAPFEEWKRKTEFYLGDRITLDVDATDGETSGDESDEDESDSAVAKTQSSEGSVRFITYEEIEAAVNTANRDRVLQHFQLCNTVARLQQKLADIICFEARAWGLIGVVLDDAGASWDKGTDETTIKLNALLESASSIGSMIANVEPLGLKTSPLTRKVLKNAIVYRTWFLDLRYGERGRERAAFVDDVVCRVSKLPPLPSKEGISCEEGTYISAKLDTVARRVRDLSAKHSDHVALFNRYKALLNDRVASNGMRKGLLSAEGVSNALGELRQTSVVSASEEMLAVRQDILRWESKARDTLDKTKVPFAELSLLKESLDAILDGKSRTRSQLVNGLIANTGVNDKVREFARSDTEALCDSLCKRTQRLYATASVWRDRADTILMTLRAYENPEAGETLEAQKTAHAMIDLKRVEDLLAEYDSLKVEMADSVLFLTRVSETSRKWASRVGDYLSNGSNTFEGCLSLVEDTGRYRPRGVIIEPTRSTVEMLNSLLRWYTEVKSLIDSPMIQENGDHVNPLLVEGLEVLAMFSVDRRQSGEFIVVPEEAQELLVEKKMSRKPNRTLSRAKLESNNLCNIILTRMVDSSGDRKEGNPLLSLLYLVWQNFVEHFVHLSNTTSSSRTGFTLERATKLLTEKPSIGASNSEGCSNILWQTNPQVDAFEEMIRSGSHTEEAARQTLFDSKGFLRESKHHMENVRLHLSKLKDLNAEFKRRVGNGSGLILSSALDQQLDRDIKLFGWLVRTFQYPGLHLNEDSFSTKPGLGGEDAGESDTRIPWEVLVGLYERMPNSDQEIGDFACAVLRVREIYEAANAWQEEISNLTMLSLRGGRRRNHTAASPAKTPRMESEEGSSSTKIGLEKVIQLSHHPILSTVAMPREYAVKKMLENTKKFEVQLHEFLGKDYDGTDLDRSPYPEPGSLVAEDGTFHLYRLTGSPLFQSLKLRIASIEEIANNVFADTPGKATFDWICKAVAWIEGIHSAVRREDFQLGSVSDSRLMIPAEAARKLLAEGQAILLNVPEDLRKTLSQHRIFVSSNKDGNMIVKSTKGGAHHAVGVTVICWCPFLFDSLKADVSKLDAWQLLIVEVSNEFIAFSHQTKGMPLSEPSSLVRCHEIRHDIANLLVQSSDLVACPTAATLDSSRTLLGLVDARLQQHSSSAMARTFAELKYKDGPSVVRNRFLLLDSLMDRSSLTPDADTSLEDLVSRDGPFRNAGRLIFEKVLRKAAEAMEIGLDSDAVFSFCSVRAWEIENALFDLFQTDLAASQISPDYRDKARALKRSLEDTGNLAFGARVLTGEIEATKLVRLTSQQLANPKTREDRARAEAAAKQNAVLTRSGSTGEDPTTSKNPPSATTSQVEPIDFDSDQKPATQVKTTKAAPQSSLKYSASKSMKLQDIVKIVKSSRLTPPPPPPSLVASLQPVIQPSGPSTQDQMISSSSSRDRFVLSLANASRWFTAGLALEADQDPEWEVDCLLPNTLTEKGRLQIKEFTSFLTGKLESEKWEAIPLRIVTSGEATKQLKKFAKDYEGKNRIAMVSLESHSKELSKLFIVTPKFHKAAKGVRFGNYRATYAVLLKLSGPR